MNILKIEIDIYLHSESHRWFLSMGPQYIYVYMQITKYVDTQ